MRAIFLLLLLAGCEATLSPTGERNFRDPNALIASKADFDLARFQGDWYEVARFPDGRDCTNARVTAIIVRPDGTGGRILNRSPGLPLDRLRAALEVLDFNGFDRSALMFVRPS